MWGSSEEPPGTMETDPPETVVNLKDTCEQSKTQLETVKDIMLRNKQTLKKKEEELQKYAKRLSKYKTRTKKSHSSKNNEISSIESTSTFIPDTIVNESVDDTDDINQANTPKAKSSLLQKKLAEDRKIFQQRSKELTESKRAVEEKVEALRQQFEEKYITPVSITSQASSSLTELSFVQDKDNKIAELSNKILELEAVVIDLQDNLKEKDSVIDSKTKAITLMSADLSKKGKTTLDSLEDTKDEMRSMQENFIVVEASLRSKNDNLLRQLEEKTEQLSILEENVHSLTNKLEAQKQVEAINADFSRSTMNTLVDTKDAMKSMQENFVLIESSLKSKNEYLLKQLEDREIKLTETEAKIINLEAGLGIEKQPNIEELLFKVEKLEEMNHNLEDEKYELQKHISGLQDKIISNEHLSNNNLLVEKDNRILELESIIKDLKASNEWIETHKMNLEMQIVDLKKKNEEFSIKVSDFEKHVLNLESEKDEFMKLTVGETETSNENNKEQKLIKELDELNKSMIKMKVEHKNKLKNMRKQLNNFKKVSDTNAELVKLGNQVALLEEEKGNLQLSLVDFDELKASASDWQQLINDLEGKVFIQAQEIQAHIEAIAILENQKLDFIQELHMAKQEISSLEAENAESENLRVTAEMKVVDLEEELEASQRRLLVEPLVDTERIELQRQIEVLVQDNERLNQKIGKLEELKNSSEIGSTDSFVKTGSNVDSTESFEALAVDTDRSELLKRIDGLTRENSVLLEKLARYEEKGSSDTGSTESFERIPETVEEASKLDSLVRKNFELSEQVTKLEEKLAIAIARQSNEYITEMESQQLPPILERMSDEIRKSRESSSFTVSAEVLEAGLAADWESDELQKPIKENQPSTDQKICAKEANIIESEQKFNYESCQIVITEQKSIIDELRTRLNDKRVEVNTEIHNQLQKKEQELQIVFNERDQLKIQLENLKKRERVLAEKLDITNRNIDQQEKKLADYAEEQTQLINRLTEQQSLIDELEAKLENKKMLEEVRTSLERQLLNMEASYEKSQQHATNISEELRQTYKSLECLKLKHTEDMNMLNRHLEDVIEELQLRTQENATLEKELSEKNNALEKSVSEEVKIKLEIQLAEMQEKVQMQLDKLKKYAAVAKKKTAQCDELETRLVELEEKWTLEKSEKETRNIELRDCLSSIESKNKKIADLEEELCHLQDDKNKALRAIEIAKEEVSSAQQKDNKIADMKEKLHNLQISRDEALQELKFVKAELANVIVKDNKIVEMTEEVQRLQNMKDEALFEVNTIKLKLSELGQKDNRIADLEEKLQHLKIDRDQVLQEFTTVKIELNETKEKISKLSEIQTELQYIKVERDSAFDKINDCLGEIAEKENKIAEIQNMLYLYQTGQESSDEINKLKGQLQEAIKKDETISKMNEELNHLQIMKEEALQEIEVLKTQLNEFKENDKIISQMKEDFKCLQKTRDEALHKIEALQVELREAKDMINYLSEAKNEARELGMRIQKVKDEASLEVNTMKMKLNEFEKKDNQIVNLEEEIYYLKVDRDQVLKELTTVKMELNEATEKISKLSDMQTELQYIKVERDNAFDKINNYVSEIEDKNNKIAEIQNMLYHCQTDQQSCDEINKLKEELQKALEKNETISNMNEELNHLKFAKEEALHEIEVLKMQLNEFTENDKIISQMKEDFKCLQNTRDEALHKIEALQAELGEAKDMINSLGEAKDEARELGVRMQVMETEYVEQLSQINSLRAENGLLLSKQAQVNERLENVEKESEERRVNLEKLEKEQLIAEMQKKEAVDGICGRCTSKLQALEAMLQERDAEIENLDNELHNSIANLMQMQEHLRMSTVPSTLTHDTAPQESYDELAHRYNFLVTHNEETRIKYEATLNNNEDLIARVIELETLIAELQTRLDLSDRDLIERCNKQDSKIIPQGLEQSRSLREDSMSVDGWSLDTSTFFIDTESKHKEQINQSQEPEKREAPPPLFDASVFGTSLSQTDKKIELDLQLEELKKEKILLNQQLANERVTAEFLREELEKFKTNRSELGSVSSTINIPNSKQEDVNYIENLKLEHQTLKTKLEHLSLEMEALKAINEELLTKQNAHKNQLTNESTVEQEKELLQKQINNTTVINDQHKLSEINIINNLQHQLEASLMERNQLVKKLEHLRKLTESASISVENEILPESMWEVDEDPWGLNEKSISHSNEEHVNIPVIPSEAIQLQVRIDELEDKLKNLEDEKTKLLEENKNLQLKNTKYVKKLKEYKLQLDNLQQQLKSQKSMSNFGADLDSTIEEELKSQIVSLGKELSDARELNKKMTVEKENLSKKIDVLTATSERFTDIKEKQDTELHIWQMRYKELETKVQQLNFDFKAKETSPAPTQSCSIAQISILEDEIRELKDNLEVLAADNEKLQQLLEEQSTKKQTSIDELQKKTVELTVSNDKLTNDYNSLRSQYEQNLMDANDQMQSIRQNCELLKQQIEEKNINIDGLKKILESVNTENELLMVDFKELQINLQNRDVEIDKLTQELSSRSEISDKEIQILKDNLTSMELSIDTYNTEIKNQTEDIRDLRAMLSNMEVTLDEKEQRLVVMQTQLHEQEMQLHERDEEVHLLRKSIGRSDLNKNKQEEKKPEEFIDFNNYENRIDIMKLDVSKNKAVQVKANEEFQTALLKQSSRTNEEAFIVIGTEESIISPGKNNDYELQRLRTELAAKIKEIEQLQEWISENLTTRIAQDMQDNINILHDEKSALEEQLAAKSQEIEALKSQVDEQHDLHKKSMDKEDRFTKLQAELQSRDKELLELRQVINDKESQLRIALQCGVEDADGLGAELLEKQRQLENLKFTVAELQSEVASLRALEGLAAEDRAVIDKLNSEKEQIRRDAQDTIERILKEKMDEINAVKIELDEEKKRLMDALSLREHDLENLKLQMKQTSVDTDALLEQRADQLVRIKDELSERERRLAELSITKDTEIYNMRVQLNEKNGRLDELISLSEEEERQLIELRKVLEDKEVQITSLKEQLIEKSKELELIQHVLQQHAINPEQFGQELHHQQLQRIANEEVRVEPTASTSSSTDELDLALYMLHQRDMRCEELTRELMQLIEERDTLQLRLSNAIRVNEELRKLKSAPVVSSPKRNSSPTEETAEHVEPLVQDASPSHSEGPIEMAREAINSSIGEDKKALAQKLLQLKTVDQGRDVRLRDERELRHAQQMSLLAHGDVLSTLPPEAAARLVNANYTLSRDVQSQSSVLMNWLWGKSTPKIVHM